MRIGKYGLGATLDYLLPRTLRPLRAALWRWLDPAWRRRVRIVVEAEEPVPVSVNRRLMYIPPNRECEVREAYARVLEEADAPWLTVRRAD